MNLLLYKSAEDLTKKGISVISTDNTKRSLFPWKKYQTNIATDEELKSMFSHKKCQGLAIVCGAVSRGLEVIDVDCKYGINFEEYAKEIQKTDFGLYSKLYIVRTKSKGYHIYYRCEIIEGNQKLANRHATEEELKDNPNVKEFVLIETRGEGGYVIAPPTDGYVLVNQVRGIPVITLKEREILLNIARSFTQVYEEIKIPPINEGLVYGLKPWDQYYIWAFAS
jgi:hypothetical protein